MQGYDGRERLERDEACASLRPAIGNLKGVVGEIQWSGIAGPIYYWIVKKGTGKRVARIDLVRGTLTLLALGWGEDELVKACSEAFGKRIKARLELSRHDIDIANVKRSLGEADNIIAF
jgi:hypothetical protein